MTRRKKTSEVVLHERYNRNHPLLRELVSVDVWVEGKECFASLLTRVPSIGEEINREDRSYRVLRVQHEPIDDDGRARAGYHAFIDAELMPSEE